MLPFTFMEHKYSQPITVCVELLYFVHCTFISRNALAHRQHTSPISKRGIVNVGILKMCFQLTGSRRTQNKHHLCTYKNTTIVVFMLLDYGKKKWNAYYGWNDWQHHQNSLSQRHKHPPHSCACNQCKVIANRYRFHMRYTYGERHSHG